MIKQIYISSRFASLLFLTLSLSLPALTQGLEVTGKIKVGDDSTTPSNGNIRYNDPEKSFEGFTDGQWASLNTASVADRPIPVTLAMFDTNPSTVWEDMDYITTHTNPFFFDLNLENNRRAVPTGYLLVIDMIEVMGMARSTNEQFRVALAASRADETPINGRVNPQVYVSGSSGTGNVTLGNGRAPLIVVRSGQQLVFLNDSDSSNTEGVRMLATGFLVEDLDQYFSY